MEQEVCDLSALKIRPEENGCQKYTKDRPTGFEDIPQEVLTKILEYCQVQDILACSHASEAAKIVTADQYFW